MNGEVRAFYHVYSYNPSVPSFVGLTSDHGTVGILSRYPFVPPSPRTLNELWDIDWVFV